MTWTNWSCVEEYDVQPGERGIRASRDIFEGELLGIYDGEIVALEIKNDRLVDRAAHRHMVQVYRFGDILFGIVTKDLSGIDFINHSCNANVRPMDRTVLVSARAVAQGEALTLDYTRWDFVPEGIRCWCEEANCLL